MESARERITRIKNCLCLLIMAFLMIGAYVAIPVKAEPGKLCHITFNNNKGTSKSNYYKSLEQFVEAGEEIVLPELPEKQEKRGVGWTTKKGEKVPLYTAGTAVRVEKDTKFYAVYEKKVYCTVSFYRSGGTLYKKVRVKKGTALQLPTLKNSQGMTMLGWSAKKGQTVNPQYQLGEEMIVNKSTKLYAVVFDRSKEPDLAESDLTKYRKDIFGKTGSFKRVIFVGDSRTFHMSQILRNQFGELVTKKIRFVCRSKTKLDWLQTVGVAKLMKLAGKDTAIIFNHGVNDLQDIDQYVSYMETLGKELKAKGCTLFYMSINPVNNKTTLSMGKPEKPEEMILNFNQTIKKQLCQNGDYIYMDCYNYLMQTGYGTATSASDGADTAPDDGLHYTAKTYKRIFDFCMSKLSTYS